MHKPLPVTQNDLRPDVIELGYGEPDPRLLPTELVQSAAAGVVRSCGRGALAYGKRPGPVTLRRAIAERIAAIEHLDVSPDDVYISAGSSQALDLILTVFTRPGDAVLVESPTFNLAMSTMHDHGVDIVSIPIDHDGLDVAVLRHTLTELASSGRRPRLLYCMPTFHNPAGVCLSAERRTALLEAATEHDLIVVEDDVYRELWYDDPSPASLWASDPTAPVIRLGSLSKSLAPGLRVGWTNARPDLLARIDAAGMLDSGGACSHFAACVASGALSSGEYPDHVAHLRDAYARRRDALGRALRKHLPPGCDVEVPGGGFFYWVGLPDAAQAAEFLPAAEAHGVAFAPGRRFDAAGDDGHVRLSFSLYDEAQLAEGARRLGAALRDWAGST